MTSTPDKPQAAGDARDLLEEVIETLESMDLHTDNPLYDKVRAFLESSPQPQGGAFAGLYEAIKHGDEAHRAWLKEAIENFAAGRPVPPVAPPQPQPSGDAACCTEPSHPHGPCPWALGDELPIAMIRAGEAVIDRADLDMKNYIPGKTIDWDSGMIADAVYRAMRDAAPTSPPSTGDELRRALEKAREYVEHKDICEGRIKNWKLGAQCTCGGDAILADINSALAQAQEGGGTCEPDREIVKDARALSHDPAASAHDIKGALKGMLNLYDALNATTFSAPRPTTKEGE